MQDKFEKIDVFNVALLFFTSIGLVNHVTIIRLFYQHPDGMPGLP